MNRNDLLKRLEQLPPEKRDQILQQLLAQRQNTVASGAAREGDHTPSVDSQAKSSLSQLTTRSTAVSGPITLASRQDPLPLSWAQQRLWFLAQLEEQPQATYNITGALRLQGQLDREVLRSALQSIVDRHEVLRTGFQLSNGQPIQAIAPQVVLPFKVVTLENQFDPQTDDPQTDATAMTDLIQSEAQAPFDLSQPPLIRITLINCGVAEHVMVCTMHHIVSDGWSIGVLVKELSNLYQVGILQQSSTLPSLSIQYADFAVWQRNWLANGASEQQLNYWRRQLAQVPTVLELPTDYSRPPVCSFRGDAVEWSLSQACRDRLNALAKQQDVTLFMVLFAAFTTLLYRYTQQPDICVGTPIANRNRAEIEPLIGFFVNTLVLRVKPEPQLTFLDLLAQVRQVSLDAYAHQDVPFEMVVDTVQLERSLSHQPLFQVMFALQNAASSTLELPGLQLTSLKARSQTAKFDLTVSLTEIERDDVGYTVPTSPGITGVWEFSTDLFDAATIERMAQHFEILVQAIVDQPNSILAELPLLSPIEHCQLQQWNQTQTLYPRNINLAQLFEQQVERSPKAIALIFEEQTLTYQELNQQANQLAHNLHQLQVGPNVLVGVCLERSITTIVALVAIIKAGGAYVPLDTDYPTERLEYMMADAHLSVLLTHSEQLPRFEQPQIPVLCVDTLSLALSTQPTTALAVYGRATDLAYVIYTSGSTGQPKGVAICQQAIARLVLHTNYIALGPHSKIAQASNVSFDAATFEIWGALLNGGQLIGTRKETLLSPMALDAHLKRYQIDTLFITTALFNQLVSSVPTIFSHLDTVLFGGEAVDPFWVRTALAQGKPRHLLHVYGPTESTTFALWYPIVSVASDATTVPIGYPLSNTTAYVLDQNRQPVPVGVAGELYIGGDGLARGYLNRSALTSERFINCLCGENQKPQRLYKTGDLVRRLSDGAIEFLGRIDHQVKIRGFRIELGEVEAVLSRHPLVREAVAIAREDQPGRKHLVAYVVPHPVSSPDPEPLTSSTLRQFLQVELPDYMIPSAFVLLDALPLNPNGKVDRRQLPIPVIATTADYVPPRTPTEILLTEIWSDILGVPEVGITHNFFQLGGDSILSIQLVARCAQAGLKLTPKQLFQYQTIGELAGVTTTITTQVSQEQVTGTAPLTPIQAWFLQQNLPNPHHFNQSTLLTLHPDVDPDTLRQALTLVIQHHDALRLRLQQTPEGTYHADYLLVSSEAHEQDQHGAEFQWFEFHDLTNGERSSPSSDDEHQMIQRIAAQTQTCLNLNHGPLLRAVLFQRGSDRPPQLLITIHHFVVDGVSWRILQEDLGTAYDQIQAYSETTGRPSAPTLPAKTTAFKDWAIALQHYCQSTDLHQELAYWQQQIGGASLPIDIASASSGDPLANTFGSTETVSIGLTTAETHALLHQVPNAYNTQINDILLTALVRCLATQYQEQQWCVDLEGHGREDLFESIDLSRTVGWFTTRFPVLLMAQPSESPETTLKRIKETLHQIPQKGLGYGVLQYMTAADGAEIALLPNLSVKAIAPISFNYLGQFKAPSAQSGERDAIGHATLIQGFVQGKIGCNEDPRGYRSNLLDVTGRVVSDQLHLSWIFSRNLHHRATIETLANAYLEALRELIQHCLDPQAGGYTPSDFPAARLSQTALDNFLAYGEKRNWLPIEDCYELSPMQQGMLFHTLYQPETSDAEKVTGTEATGSVRSQVYCHQIAWQLVGELNQDALKQSWQLVINRYPVLRTSFHWQGLDKPLQVVHPTVTLPWRVEHWQDSSDLTTTLATNREQERQVGFDMQVAPLLRLVLIRTAKNCHELVFTFHHLLLDGWSMAVVLREVFTAYDALQKGDRTSEELRALQRMPTPQFRHYMLWLQAQNPQRDRQYWQQYLQGFRRPTPLPVQVDDRTHLGFAYKQGDQHFQLSSETTTTLQSIAQQHRLTVSTIFQAAWGLVLGHYVGQTDVVFGATVSGRPPTIAQVEILVGVLINTLPIRITFPHQDSSANGDSVANQMASQIPSVLSWLQDVQTTQLDHQHHAHTPLVDIQSQSLIPQDVALFSSIVIFQNYPSRNSGADANNDDGNNSNKESDQQQSALHLTQVEGSGHTNYPISIMATPGEQLSVHFKYNANQVAYGDAQRLTQGLSTMLEAIAHFPHQDLPKLLTTLDQQLKPFPRPLHILQLETALLQLPMVVDCYCLERQATEGQHSGETVLVAYVVPSGPLTQTILRDSWQCRFGNSVAADFYCLVSTLPRTEEGAVDHTLLTQLPILNNDTVQSWGQQIKRMLDTEEVVVTVAPTQTHTSPLHLHDILPEFGQHAELGNNGLKLDRDVDKGDRLQSFPPASQALAISHGASLNLATDAPQTLSVLLHRRYIGELKQGNTTECNPSHIAHPIIFLPISQHHQASHSTVYCSYTWLWESAQSIHQSLKTAGLQPGDHVILQLSNMADFVIAVWGCILGGFVPVLLPIAPAYTTENNGGRRLTQALELLDQPPIIASDDLCAAIATFITQNTTSASSLVHSFSHLIQTSPATGVYPAQPSDIALMLLTSGSTGLPKGVPLSHHNLIHSIAATTAATQLTTSDISLNCFPLDHPGPLIRCHLRCLWADCQQIHAPTRVFLSNPLQWLDWLTQYKVTTTWAPNFAFGLVVDALKSQKYDNDNAPTWNLQPIRSILNTAEPITPQVARRFLEASVPYGLSPNAMHSSWGMAETCASATWCSNYLSLDDQNRYHDHESFAQLGHPIPGVSLRIVRQSSSSSSPIEILREGEIGVLQVNGETIMSGYYGQDSTAIFTQDGWFNTGDLGYLSNGTLTLTGRAKDVIIINGVNYYSHDIEATVETLPFVKRSYTAAVSLPSEQFVLFFSSNLGLIPSRTTDKIDGSWLQKLWQEQLQIIQSTIIQKLGIKPIYCVPVLSDIIPKTSLGKIQRSQLAKRFLAGEFNAQVTAIDCLLNQKNILPNWFFQKQWLPQSIHHYSLQSPLPVLIFCDSLGLGSWLERVLIRENYSCILVYPGDEFSALDNHHYFLNPKSVADYKQLMRLLAKKNLLPGQIFHLWTYQVDNSRPKTLEELNEAQLIGLYSLLFLTQSLQIYIEDYHYPIQLLFVSSYSQQTSYSVGMRQIEKTIAYEKSTVLGLLKTIAQEHPLINCRHLDLVPHVEEETLSQPLAQQLDKYGNYLLAEIKDKSRTREVSYRNGYRLVPCLKAVDWSETPDQPVPFYDEGTYLITGGMGGIGYYLAEFLLRRYHATVVLLGRSSATIHQEKIDRLKQLSGQVIYYSVDVCDRATLTPIISHWKSFLSGVIHLAGISQRRFIVDETVDTLLSTLKPKVFGAWLLNELLSDQPDIPFIHFSSVNGTFGGVTVGGYAAANSFLDTFSNYQRQTRPTYCLAWSMWNETGMSQGYEMKQFSQERGYCAIEYQQGLQSLSASFYALANLAHPLLIGLDGNNPHLYSSQLEHFQLEILTAHLSLSKVLSKAELIKKISDSVTNVSDHNISFQVRFVDKFSRNMEGELTLEGSNTQTKISKISVKPTSPIEIKISQVWEKVLDQEINNVHDNFFQLGGHSLLVLKVIAALEETFGIQISISTLFQHPTVAQLSKVMDSAVSGLPSRIPSYIVRIQPNGSKPPLFCVHPIGGSIFCYSHLSQNLGADYPIYGIQSVGIDGNQTPLSSISEMAERYIEGILSIQPYGPYYLSGWSFGGIVAYEIVHQLQQMDYQVNSLILFDSYTPQVIDLVYQNRLAQLRQTLTQSFDDLRKEMYTLSPSIMEDVLDIVDFLQDLNYSSIQLTVPDLRVIYQYVVSGKLNLIFSDIQLKKYFLENLDFHVEALFKVFKANRQSRANYVLKPDHVFKPCNVLLFRAKDQAKKISGILNNECNKDVDWSAYINSDQLVMETVLSSHYQLLRNPSLRKSLKSFLG